MLERATGYCRGCGGVDRKCPDGSFSDHLGPILREQRCLHAAAHRRPLRVGMAVFHRGVRRSESDCGAGDRGELLADVHERASYEARHWNRREVWPAP